MQIPFVNLQQRSKSADVLHVALPVKSVSCREIGELGETIARLGASRKAHGWRKKLLCAELNLY